MNIFIVLPELSSELIKMKRALEKKYAPEHVHIIGTSYAEKEDTQSTKLNVLCDNIESAKIADIVLFHPEYYKSQEARILSYVCRQYKVKHQMLSDIELEELYEN